MNLHNSKSVIIKSSADVYDIFSVFYLKLNEVHLGVTKSETLHVTIRNILIYNLKSRYLDMYIFTGGFYLHILIIEQ